MSTTPDSQTISRAAARAVFSFVMLVLLLPAMLFISAGTLNWPMGWAYVIVTLAVTLVSRIIMLRTHPDLALERGGQHSEEGVQEWDKHLPLIVGFLGPMIALIVCGLNYRFAWPPAIPMPVQIASLGITVLAGLLSTWAFLHNKFFSATVRIQKDRGHAVVSSGPYSFIRHPGYAGGIVADFSGPLALGSFWALIPGLIMAVITVYRTAREDQVLKEQLDGYTDYAGRVRYRLLPLVW
jgi:protein-S-isoprenylcysteine O-methyltransferase Ste14